MLGGLESKRRSTLCILESGDQIHFCEIGNALVHAATAPKTGELRDQRGGDDFVVLAALLDLRWRVNWRSANGG